MSWICFEQPRDTCYVASEGLTQLVYSGYQPHAYTWNDFPPLKDILDLVRLLSLAFSTNTNMTLII